MIQHSVITSALAPLLVLAGPTVLRALRRRARRLAVRAARAATRPMLAWPLFVSSLWALNVPAVLAWLEARPLIHAVSHGLFLGVAVLFWLPVLGRPRRLSGLAAGAYLLVATMASDLIGVWYMAEGQTLAGVAMVAGMLPVATAALVLTWTGLRREEQRQARWETYADAAR